MKIISWYGSAGSLMVSEKIDHVTQTLIDCSAKFYGGKYLVCETITMGAAAAISNAMGWVFVESLAKATLHTFSRLSINCEHHRENDADCHHPEKDFDCMTCHPSNCPLLLEGAQ